MINLVATAIKQGLKFGAKKLLNYADKTVRDDDEGFFDIKSLNKGEDEEVRSWDIKKRDVRTWSDNDVNTVMRSYSYKYDKETQKKVQDYFDYKYPGKQKYDATGKMIR